MSVINLLSSSLGNKGNEANIELAKQIVAACNKKSIQELVDNLNHKDKNIQSDCIKTLYEIGYLKPQLIADYFNDFLNLLNSKNNRMVWGGMIAIATISPIKHKEIFASINIIKLVIDNGSVITMDNGVEILAQLNKFPEYAYKTEPWLIEILWKCPIKQFPMYIEKSIMATNKENKKIFQSIIEKRKIECDKDSQLKRLNKALVQISKISN